MTDKLSRGLLFLRLSVFLVMLVWTVDKFLNPAHSAKVFEHFYFLPGLSPTVFMILGLIQLIVILGFLVGYKKKITYGLVVIMHAISTGSTIGNLLDPYAGMNLLFFAGVPMLAGCYLLYLMRDEDVLMTLDS